MWTWKVGQSPIEFTSRAVDPRALRQLREERHWTQDRLAEASGVSQRQIARIESGGVAAPRTLTLQRIADALEVDMQRLFQRNDPASGTLDASADTHVPAEMYLPYDLLQIRYGIGMGEVVRLAPFLFALLAELSATWRKTLLREVDVYLRRIGEFSEENGHTYFSAMQSHWREAVAEAEESLSQPMLHDSLSAPDGGVNPFRDYMLHLAKQIDQPDVVRLEDAAGFSVCDRELQRITGGNQKAARALQSGRVRIADIPSELMADHALEARVSWLSHQDF